MLMYFSFALELLLFGLLVEHFYEDVTRRFAPRAATAARSARSQRRVEQNAND